jgi:hypothetical protein
VKKAKIKRKQQVYDQIVNNQLKACARKGGYSKSGGFPAGLFEKTKPKPAFDWKS